MPRWWFACSSLQQGSGTSEIRKTSLHQDTSTPNASINVIHSIAIVVNDCLLEYIFRDFCQLTPELDVNLNGEFCPILRRHNRIHMIGLSFSSVTSEHLDGSVPLRLERLLGSNCQSIIDPSKILGCINKSPRPQQLTTPSRIFQKSGGSSPDQRTYLLNSQSLKKHFFPDILSAICIPPPCVTGGR